MGVFSSPSDHIFKFILYPLAHLTEFWLVYTVLAHTQFICKDVPMDSFESKIREKHTYNDVEQLNIELQAYEKMISSYTQMLEDSFGGSEEFIESRLQKLNGVYAELLIRRELMKEEAVPVGV
jgi:hypothetical protein